jgi:hypothetical protein
MEKSAVDWKGLAGVEGAIFSKDLEVDGDGRRRRQGASLKELLLTASGGHVSQMQQKLTTAAVGHTK